MSLSPRASSEAVDFYRKVPDDAARHEPQLARLWYAARATGAQNALVSGAAAGAGDELWPGFECLQGEILTMLAALRRNRRFGPGPPLGRR